MPTTRTLDRARHQAAISWRASNASATCSDGDIGPGRELDRTLDEQDRGAGAHRVGREAMSIGPLAGQGNEATARDDVARVNRGGGEGGDPR